MKKTLAIVGYGGQGAWHASWAQKSDCIALAGVFDISEKRVNAAKENGIHVYESREELLADKDVDIVVCATPNDSHKEIVIAALEAGKHVVCEKPVALSLEDFDLMCLAAKKAGTIYSPIEFFSQNAIPRLTYETVAKMSEDEFAKRAFSWRGRQTVLRNLEMASPDAKKEEITKR